MADNKTFKDGAVTDFIAATDELPGAVHSPKVSILKGDSTDTLISPATSGGQDTLNTVFGAQADAAAGTDTATASFIALFKRQVQKFTSLLGQLPASLGQKTKANSLAVTVASDQDVMGVSLKPQPAANGATASRIVAAASTNATNLKNTAGQVYHLAAFNLTASLKYLKLYDKASAPTVGTDAPVWTIPLPANGGFSMAFPHGRSFALGVAYAITGGLSDADATAVAAGDVHGTIMWI